ncbi:MAG: immunoglobulin domain-containing protein [Opitutaceae bacterium]
MKLSSLPRRPLWWLNLPSVMLLTLLQRTPFLKLAVPTGVVTHLSPISSILRSAFTSVASLGVVHALAGATELATTSPSPLTTTVGANVQVGFAITGTVSAADRWTTGGSVPPGLTFSGGENTPLILSGKPTVAGTFLFTVQGNDAIGGDTQVYTYTIIVTGGTPDVAPTVSAQPTAQSTAVGGSVTLSVTAAGTPTPTYQWYRNGRAVTGATSATLSLTNVQPANAGVYSVVATNGAGSVTSAAVPVSVSTTDLFVGTAFSDPAWRSLQHPNGNLYTQILLTGAAATVTADAGKVTRISFIDLQDDIIQLEFSGPGSMTITLDNPSGPALPTKYNQAVEYMRGHPTVLIQGAGANTFFSAFSVGSLTAVNQALFKGDVTYDGHADLARLAIQSPTGEFGGLFMGNGAFSDTNGVTGVYAPGITVRGNIRINDIRAFDTAAPVLVFGATPNAENGLRINGGDLEQANGKAIELRGVNKVIMGNGTDSHGRAEAAQINKAKFETSGSDVTTSVVVNPPSP